MIRGATIAAIGGIIVLILLLGSWYTIDQTERGVLLRNGAVIGTAQPGLGFKLPVMDSVQKGQRQDRDLYLGQDELLFL
jgi:regulator of protease activity HflC (stomatin/prohibitin superfamily)